LIRTRRRSKKLVGNRLAEPAAGGPPSTIFPCLYRLVEGVPRIRLGQQKTTQEEEEEKSERARKDEERNRWELEEKRVEAQRGWKARKERERK